MSQHTKIILAAVALGIGLFAIIYFDLLRKSGLMYCEGFGCLGVGILHFVIGGAIPLVLMLGATLLCRTDRVAAAITGFVAGAVCAGLALSGAVFANNIRVHQDVCASIKQCENGNDQHRRLCTWELAPDVHDQYPQCFEE